MATTQLQPVNKHTDMCALMTFLFQIQPFWIQVSYKVTITGYWVYKREMIYSLAFVNTKDVTKHHSANMCLGGQYMCGDQTCIGDTSMYHGVPNCSTMCLS